MKIGIVVLIGAGIITLGVMVFISSTPYVETTPPDPIPSLEIGSVLTSRYDPTQPPQPLPVCDAFYMKGIDKIERIKHENSAATENRIAILQAANACYLSHLVPRPKPEPVAPSSLILESK